MDLDLKNEKPSPGLEEFVFEFLQDRQTEFEEMKESLATSSFDNIRKLAHKWKGFCAPYGFNHLGVLSESLEKTAEEKNIDESTDLINQISEYLIAKEDFFKKAN